MANQPYVPRASRVITGNGLITRDWDASFFQPVVAAVNALSSLLFSGPDADPNGVVVASPGAFYTQRGGVTSALYVKESGVNTNTGWVLK